MYGTRRVLFKIMLWLVWQISSECTNIFCEHSIGFSAVLYRRNLVLTTHSSVPTCKHRLCCSLFPISLVGGHEVKQSCRGCGISSPSVGWTLAATARTTSVVVCPFVPLAWKHKDKSLNILPNSSERSGFVWPNSDSHMFWQLFQVLQNSCFEIEWNRPAHGFG